MLERKVIDPDFTRDVRASDIPGDVLDVLLADRTTGKNILWMTDGYEHLESVFDAKMGMRDEINAGVLARPGNKVIRPRVDKSKAEQRERVQKKAEVFTPSWICNNMLFLKDTSSPQEYDQTEFRLQSSFVHSMPGGHSWAIKYNMRLQTLLVVFDPAHMFHLQETRPQAYNINTDRNGNAKPPNRHERLCPMAYTEEIDRPRQTAFVAREGRKHVFKSWR